MTFQNANNSNIFKSFLYYLKSTTQLKEVEVLFGSGNKARQTNSPLIVIYPTDVAFDKGQGYVRNQDQNNAYSWSTWEYLMCELHATSRSPNAQYENHCDVVMELQARLLSALVVQKASLFTFQLMSGGWSNLQGGFSQRGAAKKLLIGLNIPVLFEPNELVEVEETPIMVEIDDSE